jgi:hAT family C-terminal dimerisation region
LIRRLYVDFTQSLTLAVACLFDANTSGSFINEKWELVALPLECAPFNGSHTAARMLTKIEQMLARSNISTERVSAIVMDNAANAKLAGEMAPFDSLPCTPHTLQLTVKKILDDPAIAKLLKVVRKIVGAFKHSALKVEELRHEQKQLGLKLLKLIQDVRTRWSSTYLMLHNFLLNRAAIEIVCMRHKDPAPAARKRSRAAVTPPAAPIAAAPAAAAAAAATSAADDALVAGTTSTTKAVRNPNRTSPQRTRIRSGALALLRPGALADADTSTDEYSSSDDGSVDIGGPSSVPDSAADLEIVESGESGDGSSDSESAQAEARSSANTSAAARGRGSGTGRSMGRGRGRGRGRDEGRAIGNSSERGAAVTQRKQQRGSKRKRDKHMRQLTDEQWDTLQLLQDMLKPFHEAQTLLEGEKYVTSSWVPFHIKSIRQQLSAAVECSDDSIKALAKLLLEDFNERWTEWPRAVYICAALDPRTKKMRCFNNEEQAHAWDLVRAEMQALETRRCAVTASGGNSEQQQDAGAASGAAVTAGSAEPAGRSKLDELLGADTDSDDDDGVDASADTAYILQQRIGSEVKLYKSLSKLGNTSDDNPLEWWQQHASAYPLLAAVARKWLAVPASSAASERVFSSAGLTVSSKRTSLGTERVATLVFLKAAWPVLEKLRLLHGSARSASK